MPAEPIHPDQLAGEQRFHADLVAYLNSLPVGGLAELLKTLDGSVGSSGDKRMISAVRREWEARPGRVALSRRALRSLL